MSYQRAMEVGRLGLDLLSMPTSPAPSSAELRALDSMAPCRFVEDRKVAGAITELQRARDACELGNWCGTNASTEALLAPGGYPAWSRNLEYFGLSRNTPLLERSRIANQMLQFEMIHIAALRIRNKAASDAVAHVLRGEGWGRSMSALHTSCAGYAQTARCGRNCTGPGCCSGWDNIYVLLF